MTPETKSISPTGRYMVQIFPWEVRMSHWIETPQLLDTHTQQRLISFEDSTWSLNQADWQSNSVVKLSLRRYPGNHTPSSVEVLVDCEHDRATVEGTVVEGLANLEAALERAIGRRQ